MTRQYSATSNAKYIVIQGYFAFLITITWAVLFFDWDERVQAVVLGPVWIFPLFVESGGKRARRIYNRAVEKMEKLVGEWDDKLIRLLILGIWGSAVATLILESPEEVFAGLPGGSLI